jgi:hypothetical protein
MKSHHNGVFMRLIERIALMCLGFFFLNCSNFWEGIADIMTPDDPPAPPIIHPINHHDSLALLAIMDSNRNHIQLSAYNDLRSMSTTDSLGNVTNLEIRNVDTFILTNDFENLESLQSLSINFDLQKLIFHASNPENLHFSELCMCFHKIDTLPTDIYRLTNLSSLRIDHGPLQIVFDSISNLINLTRISLFDNKLKTLPNDLLSLNKLQYLDIGRNYLCSLPSQIDSFYLSKKHYYDTTQNCP